MLSLVVLALTVSQQVTAVPIVFPSATSTYVNNGSAGVGNTALGFFFQAGNSVTETFNVLLPSINTASFTFTLTGNSTNFADPVNFDVLINSVTIGNFVASTAIGSQIFNLSYSFTDILAAPGYTVTFLETNTVAQNHGSVTFAGLSGSGDLSAAPELTGAGALQPLALMTLLLLTSSGRRQRHNPAVRDLAGSRI
jgi:hypothetical protein